MAQFLRHPPSLPLGTFFYAARVVAVSHFCIMWLLRGQRDNWNLSEGCCKASSLQHGCPVLCLVKGDDTEARLQWKRLRQRGWERAWSWQNNQKNCFQFLLRRLYSHSGGSPEDSHFLKKIIEFSFPGYSYSIELLYWQPKVTTHFSTPGEKSWGDLIEDLIEPTPVFTALLRCPSPSEKPWWTEKEWPGPPCYLSFTVQIHGSLWVPWVSVLPNDATEVSLLRGTNRSWTCLFSLI